MGARQDDPPAEQAAHRPSPFPIDPSRADRQTRRTHGEARYRMLVELGRDLITLHDTDGRYRYVTPSVERLLGYAPAELIGTDYHGYLHPDDVDRIDAAADRLLIHGEVQEAVRYRFRRKDGSWAWMETLGVPLREDASDPQRITGVMTSSRDVTAALAAAQALATSEERLRLAIRTAGLGIYDISFPSRVGYYSDEYLAIFGYGPEHRAWFNAGWEPTVHPQDAPAQIFMRERLRRGEQEYVNSESRRMHADGRWIWVRILGRAFAHDERGRPTRMVSVVQDIDEHRRAIADLEESRARLRHAQAMARLGDWLVDLPTLTHRWSDEAFRVLGFEPGECEPSLAAFLSRVHPDDVGRITEVARRMQRDPVELRTDVRLCLPDGSLRHVSLHMAVARDTEGRALRLDGTVQDVTEHKRAEADLRSMRDQLRELSSHHEDRVNEERKRIALDVHDELGQMLTAMKLQVDLLQSQLQDRAAADAAAARLRTLIEDTIEVTRNVALNLRPPALDLGLVPALEWLAEDFSLRTELPCSVEATAGEVALGEKAAIELFRIAQESLTNVARHAGARHVRLALQQSGGTLQLSIHDDGCGFDPQGPSRVGHFGLLGMRERALRLGAELEIRSRPGQGTTIAVQLPLGRRQARTARSPGA